MIAKDVFCLVMAGLDGSKRVVAAAEGNGDGKTAVFLPIPPHHLPQPSCLLHVGIRHQPLYPFQIRPAFPGNQAQSRKKLHFIRQPQRQRQIMHIKQGAKIGRYQRQQISQRHRHVEHLRELAQLIQLHNPRFQPLNDVGTLQPN